MAYLLRKHIENGWEISEVSGPNLVIGCGVGADLRLDDGSLGLEHLSIRQQEARFIVLDHQSLTGTYVNGERVQRTVLADGDRISIGSYVIHVRQGDSAESLILEIARITPESPVKAPAAESLPIDYAAAYSLESHSLNKTLLTWVLLAIGVMVLAGVVIAGKTGAFRPGPVSQAHMLIANQCSQCHVPFHGPSVNACEACHRGREHHNHVNNAAAPTCVTCHVEHRRAPMLARVDNRACTGCHEDLKTIDPKTRQQGASSKTFATRVTDFAADHPQFAVSKIERSEPGQEKAPAQEIERLRLDQNVKGRMWFLDDDLNHKIQGQIFLNHKVHLDKPVKNLQGASEPLNCQSCHAPAQDGRRMAPISYTSHCARCHDDKLEFDAQQFPGCRVPHGDVEVARKYVRMVYAESLCKPVPATAPERRLLFEPRREAPILGRPEILQDSENRLFQYGCGKCHKVPLQDGQVSLKVIDAFIPKVWFNHAQFAHKEHRMLECVGCHVKLEPEKSADGKKRITALTSEKTEDVLMPGIAVCRECHKKSDRRGAVREASATTNCSSCHVYHDKKQNGWVGKKSIDLKTLESSKK